MLGRRVSHRSGSRLSDRGRLPDFDRAMTPTPALDLRGPRVLLRPWRAADLAPFAALNADPEVMEHLPAPLTREESDATVTRIDAHLAAHGFTFWAVEVPGEAPFAGFVGLVVPRFEAHFTPCVEIGWRLAREHWGKGYAVEAAAVALRAAFGPLGLHENRGADRPREPPLAAGDGTTLHAPQPRRRLRPPAGPGAASPPASRAVPDRESGVGRRPTERSVVVRAHGS